MMEGGPEVREWEEGVRRMRWMEGVEGRSREKGKWMKREGKEKREEKQTMEGDDIRDDTATTDIHHTVYVKITSVHYATGVRNVLPTGNEITRKESKTENVVVRTF